MDGGELHTKRGRMSFYMDQYYLSCEEYDRAEYFVTSMGA
jgi:hypothetical protein